MVRDEENDNLSLASDMCLVYKAFLRLMLLPMIFFYFFSHKPIVLLNGTRPCLFFYYIISHYRLQFNMIKSGRTWHVKMAPK